jgi:hypothetical protein
MPNLQPTGRDRYWTVPEGAWASHRTFYRCFTADEDGRGLTVVAALASRWGWRPEPFGKVVWCELAVTPGHVKPDCGG